MAYKFSSNELLYKSKVCIVNRHHSLILFESEHGVIASFAPNQKQDGLRESFKTSWLSNGPVPK